MNRLDGLRRAAKFDDASYSECTIELYRARAKRFELAARESNIDPLAATTDWILHYFFTLSVRSLAEARGSLPAIARFFRTNGREAAFPYQEVHNFLRETSDHARDPLLSAIDTVTVPRKQRQYARAIAGKSNEKTRERYAKMVQVWEMYCRRFEINMLAPSVRQFLGFLAYYAGAHKYSTVSVMCFALSHYFENANAVNITRHKKVRAFLFVIAKEKAQTSLYRPLFAEDLKAMVMTLGVAPVDIRDRVILLLTFYGPLFPTHMSKMQNNVTERPDGVEVEIEGTRIFVGAVEDDQLDIRIWMSRWMQLLGADPRPLFPTLTRRGEWGYTGTTPARMCDTIRRAAARANINVPYPSLALRKGFVVRAARVVEPIQIAQQMRLKGVSSLGVHIALPGRGEARRRRPMGPSPSVSKVGIETTSNNAE